MARILIIDDDELVNGMLVQLLSNEGYEVESTIDGNCGLKLWETRQFDLVVTDILMPEKEGFEIIIEIRKKNKTVPIIAISGGGKIGPEEYLELAKTFGANHVFLKPFDTRSFCLAIKKCLS
ncbi:MAG: response regulator [Candidatus Riflebacteria bacterium]|nr:response regulator [Candidatus Riflebacteria bacterium]